MDKAVRSFEKHLKAIREEMAETGSDIRDIRNAIINVLNQQGLSEDAWFAKAIGWWDDNEQ